MRTSTVLGQPTRVFKRYSNRKYYDPRESRYVNYAEIAKVIREGADVRVLESETLQDVTGVILARILSREEKRGTRTSPRALTSLIREPANSPAPPEPAAQELPEEVAGHEPEWLLHSMLAKGERAVFGARRRAADAAAAVERLDQRARARMDAATEALAELGRLTGRLSRICRRIDELHERLRVMEGQ